MSIVAFFSYLDKKRIRIKVINKIHDLNYGFLPTTNLHCTLFTIYPSKESFIDSNPYFNEMIKERIKKFFDIKITKQNLTKIKLRFHEIRPGTWLKDQYPIPYASNGTVVAIGKGCMDGNKEFVSLDDNLINCLKDSLYPVFGDKFDRNFPTIWSTLGYFNHSDFDINENFADTFNQFKKQYDTDPMEIVVDTLKLVEYSFKDLRDANTLLEFKLL